MSIKNDAWIRAMAEQKEMITPFVPHQVRERGVISYGVTSFGYDMRIGNTFKRYQVQPNKTINPKRIDQSIFHTTQVSPGFSYQIPPYSYVLGYSIEYFRIPENILVLVIGKSTYARAGLIVNVTPGEPGWEGQWTIELSNPTPLPIEIFPHEGIAQCVFFEGDAPVETYASKNGKYMGQTGITMPLVENVYPGLSLGEMEA